MARYTSRFMNGSQEDNDVRRKQAFAKTMSLTDVNRLFADGLAIVSATLATKGHLLIEATVLRLLVSGSLAFDTLLRVGKDDCVLCCAKNLSYIGEIKMGETTYIGRVTVTDGSIHITDASYAHRWMAERQIPFLEMGHPVIFTSPGGLDEIIKSRIES
ncbi:hypothetical protein M8J77_008791 [Diaphorina citri]|nr:hypothetical protein M8J77_008791 [Diaphorina citri]